jgi:phosphohistidine phosphatase
VWCSTARRTMDTWRHLGAEVGGEPDVRFDDRVYDAAVSDLLDVVRDTPKRVDRVLLVGHNPGVQELVLTLAQRGSQDARALAAAKYPTAALAVLDIEPAWADLGRGAAVLSAFAVPRG